MSAVIRSSRRDCAIDPRPLPPFTAARFEAFVGGLRPVFHRADQFLRFRAYLRGLLEPTPRKDVESIAASASVAMTVEAELAQALQHFVSHSPWDANRLLSAVRRATADTRRDAAAVWVVHDGVFAKKGRHSVGVQRQFARAVGKKLNCQVAVVIGESGPGGYVPLAARLYLPANWLAANPDAAAKTIPGDCRKPVPKAEIALQLLDQLREDGEPPRPLLAEDGYRTNHAFADGLAERALAAVPASDSLPFALEQFERLKDTLGLDHFEGRTRAGWHHHVALVFAAAHFLIGK